MGKPRTKPSPRQTWCFDHFTVTRLHGANFASETRPPLRGFLWRCRRCGWTWESDDLNDRIISNYEYLTLSHHINSAEHTLAQLANEGVPSEG